ncbi:MAG: hypothetical protein NT016_03365 [Candidatus Aenigmarchaeota archaeon]|nr:hypothetical protein [Candidatus Aenigmarchaeota archaeon]
MDDSDVYSLAGNKKSVLTYLYTFSGRNEMVPFDKIKTDTGITESSLYRSLKSLSDMGLIWRQDFLHRQLKKSSEKPRGGPIPGGYACRTERMDAIERLVGASELDVVSYIEEIERNRSDNVSRQQRI